LLGEIGAEKIGAGLLLAPALGRWGMVFSIRAFPAARQEGLGYLVKKHLRWQEFAFASLVAAVPTLSLLGLNGLLLWGLMTLFLATLGWRISRSIGGMTGDAYGAICELGEIGVMILLSVNPLTELI
jgi:adenosylcobinamide-GDP ribazoletransferase